MVSYVAVNPTVTPLTQLLDIDVPVICAPSCKTANATLAIHASLGGGFGFIPAAHDGILGVRRELVAVKSALEARGVLHPHHLPVGLNLLGWKLEEGNTELKAIVDAALEHRVQAIWLGFGQDLARYVRHIREHDVACGGKTLVFVGVTSVPQALVAAHEYKADVVVAQGIESGVQVPTLVSNIATVLPKEGPLVLAASGLATGAHVPTLLGLGAAGVVLSPHHYAHHHYGERLVTVRL